MIGSTQRGEAFFPVMGFVLITLVVAGFAPLAFARPGGPLAMPLLLHAHGAVFFCWYLLFIVQARLIGSGRIALHMRLGKLSVALAVAMVVLACLVIRFAYANPGFSIAGMSAAASTMFPITDIVNFVIVYSAALVLRRRAETHKRLMLMAGILMIDPAVARVSIVLGAPVVFILLLELALFAAVIGYDIRTRRRPHWASLFGLALYIVAMVAKLTVAQQPWWETFVGALLT